MLTEFKVSRCSRKCSVLDRPLKPGEKFYSVVFEEDEEFTRQDISAEAWEGPPEGALGWWAGRMPEQGTGKMRLAPVPVLVELVKQMASDPNRAAIRYLLALLLLRKRAVRPVESLDQEDRDKLHLEVVADGTPIELEVCEIPEGRRDQFHEELTELLYCEVEE